MATGLERKDGGKRPKWTERDLNVTVKSLTNVN